MQNDKKDTALKKPTPAETGGADGFTQLQKLLVDALKDIYWAESALLQALPNQKDAATTPALKLAIEEHIVQTTDHITRLEQAFELCGERPAAKKCLAMEGLLKEAEEILTHTQPGAATRDAAIIFAAQKIEHYEIATYGGLTEFARTLGIKELVGLFQATLDEEKQTDQLLTLLAQTGINWQAEHEQVAMAV